MFHSIQVKCSHSAGTQLNVITIKSTCVCLLTSEGKMEQKIDGRIGAVSAMMWALKQSVVVERKLSQKAKLSIYRHLVRMLPGRLPGEVFRACPSGNRPQGRPRTRWIDYISWLVWERLWVPTEELVVAGRERRVCIPLLRLLPPQPGPG